jgi:hypothetical protein
MNVISTRAHSDFQRARFRAMLNRVWGAVAGQPTGLLPFEEIKKKCQLGNSVYRGIRTIKLEQIIGSLNREQDFDRSFRPTSDNAFWRWRSVDCAFHKDIALPPVELYKVGEIYFVVDGHHRISVARNQGQVFIEADVREFNIVECRSILSQAIVP